MWSHTESVGKVTLKGLLYPEGHETTTHLPARRYTNRGSCLDLPQGSCTHGSSGGGRNKKQTSSHGKTTSTVVLVQQETGVRFRVVK